MAMRSTNYYNTFISVSNDSKREIGTTPPSKTPHTVAQITYELISENPYKYTSDEILYKVYCLRNEETTIEDFSIKKQACFRCSPLSQRYGWGFHFDTDGRIAIYGLESQEYQLFLDDGELSHKTAFSSKG